MDPTIGVIVVGALTLAGTIITVSVGNNGTRKLLVYRMDQLEEKVEKHNKFSSRLEAIETECTRRQTDCKGKFKGAERDLKEHVLQCHPDARLNPPNYLEKG